MRRIALLLLFLAAMALIAAGCGDDDGNGGGGSTGTDAAMEQGEAMEDGSGEAMEGEPGDAMESESGDAMEGEPGGAMEGESGDAMESESGDAMKDESGVMKDDAMDSEAMESTAMEDEAGASMAPRRTKIKVVDSEYGRVIADGRGEALYLFDREGTTKPRCYGDCARAWPPVLTKGGPVAGRGAKQSLLGTTRRADGKLQVTYDGHPLYYYVSDSPGTILCHDVAEFGGLWLVVKPNGEPAA